MLTTLDADQHLFEDRTTWRDHIDPAWHEDALAIEDDERGWAWLTWRGQRLFPAEPQEPCRPETIGDARRRRDAGEPADVPYDEQVPAPYRDAGARLALLDEHAIDAAVLFPNYGLLWEEALAEDVGALCANLRAANRWQAEVVADGRGRLFGVGHLVLRDVDWAVEEVRALGRGGVRLAMVAPAPVDGRPLGDRRFDPVWAACCDAGVAPVFHVGGFAGALHPAWYQGETEDGDRLMDSVFLSVAPAVAVAYLVLSGTFERFPDLRLGVVELTAGWLPRFLLALDGATDFYSARHPDSWVDLPRRPSDYVFDHVRVAALAVEGPAALVARTGEDVFMFGSDWPHAEGLARPLADYEAAVGSRLGGRARSQLFGGNARWLLGL